MEKKTEGLQPNKKGNKPKDAAKEFDELLHDKKAVLHEIFARTNALLLVADHEGTLVFVNPAFEKLTGRTSKEVVGRSIESLHPTESWPFIEKKFREHLSQGFIDVECPFLTKKKGEIKIVSLNSAALRDESGRVLRAIAIGKDITELKKIETALKESETTFRRLFENAQDAIILIDADTGEITNSNPFFEKITGYSRKELFGRKAWTVSPLKDVIPNKARFKKVIGRKCVRYEDLPLKTKDGRSLNVEFVSSLYHSDHTSILQCNIRDITERRSAELACKVSEERFRQLADQAREWVWEVDASGLYTYSNQAVNGILGYKPEELVGKKHFYELFAPEDVKALMKEVSKLFALKKEFHDFENRNVHRNGNFVWLQTRCIPIFNKDGDLSGYRGLDMDITAHKAFDEVLKASEEKYSRVVEHANDGILIVQDGLIKFANTASKKLSGFKNENAIGTPFQKYLAPDEVANVVKNCKDRLAGKKVPHKYETKIKKNDGTIIPVELNAVVGLYEGRPADYVFVHDLTERRKTEEHLRYSAKRLEEANKNLVEAHEALTKKVHELEIFNKMAVGRELKLIEQKKRIQELKERLRSLGQEA